MTEMELLKEVESIWHSYSANTNLYQIRSLTVEKAFVDGKKEAFRFFKDKMEEEIKALTKQIYKLSALLKEVDKLCQ